MDDHALMDDYLRLYNLCFDHNITVAEVLNMGWQGFRFRRTLHGETLELWRSLKDRCEDIKMGVGRDRVEWTLTGDKNFSTKSLYRKLVTDEYTYPQKFLWKVKIPAKIKVFLWLVNKRSILTKDSLIKRGWVGSNLCVMCGREETIDHLFFTCTTASLLWSILKCSFNLKSIPNNFEECFGGWVKTFVKQERKLVLVGISAMLWAIWKTEMQLFLMIRNTLTQ